MSLMLRHRTAAVKHYICFTCRQKHQTTSRGARVAHCSLDVQPATECADYALGQSSSFKKKCFGSNCFTFSSFLFPPFLTFQSTKVTVLYAAIWAAAGIMWSALLEALSAAAATTAKAAAQSIKITFLLQCQGEPDSIPTCFPPAFLCYKINCCSVLKINIDTLTEHFERSFNSDKH